MKQLLVDEKKAKTIYKEYTKNSVWDYGWLVKSSYVVEKILIITGIILALSNVCYIIFVSHDPLDLILLIITGGFPYGISLIFRTVYREWTLKEYKFRGFEKIGVSKDCFEYSYDAPLSNIRNTYTLNISDINHVEYNEKKHELTAFGNIIFNETVQGEIISEKQVDSISLLNIFKKDLVEYFKANNVFVEEV